MNTLRAIFAYQVRDLARSKWLVAYMLFFFAAAELLLRYAGGDAKALLSLSTVVLLVVPLVTAVYATVYLYHSREFMELLLAQPVRRGRLFAGLYLGVTAAMAAAVIVGVLLPILLHAELSSPPLRGIVATLVFAIAALTCVFTAVAFVIAIRCEDRMRGLGTAIGVWLTLALVYDAVVLVGIASFSSLALERPVLAAMFLNPIDLARVLLLMRFDSAALMGYTGAVFQRFFGGPGTAVAALALCAWITVPVALGARAFRRKDF